MDSPIIVVDDEPDILQFLHDVLQLEGFSVVPIAKPDVLENVDPEIRPALFLLDVMLPGVSGLELARQLREKGFDTTPMIAMSASPVMLQTAAESGLFSETIAKPFDVSAVVECIRRYTL